MKKLCLICIAVISFFMVSCTAEITLTNSSKGCDIAFNAAAEKGFEKLIKSMGSENQAFIDTVQITEELNKAGFKSVKVSQKTAADVSVGMLAENIDNFLFKSGIVASENKLYKTDFSKETLQAFYNTADSSIIQVLDLLLAPVFNDEEMSVEEYLEVIASFYGDAVAEELSASKVKVVSKGASVKSVTYSLPEILCGLAD